VLQIKAIEKDDLIPKSRQWRMMIGLPLSPDAALATKSPLSGP
jgi:hypothetical protein